MSAQRVAGWQVMRQLPTGQAGRDILGFTGSDESLPNNHFFFVGFNNILFEVLRHSLEEIDHPSFLP